MLLPLPHLVLVGGGHAHVQVLRHWMMNRPSLARLTVIVDRPVAVYSGMVPGFVAGQYSRHELEIDVRPLARRAGARVVVAKALRIDAEARLVHVQGRPPVPYDVASVNIGSTVAGTTLPGVSAHALPTRPIGRFCRQIDAVVAALPHGPRVVVVGGGAGGVELAACLGARIEGADVTLVTSERLLPGRHSRVAAHVHAALTARGVTVVQGRVQEVLADAVLLEDGTRLPADVVPWAGGAAALPLFGASGLETDPEGFVRVRDTLQVLGHDDLFAVGDCASVGDHQLAKAGVYAVRQGPVLTRNLLAVLAGGRASPYRPQTDFLTLLNLGDGTAIASKWGMAVTGASLLRWKDHIDRRFMEKFQVLGPGGVVRDAFASMAGDMEEMVCGGCAAKVAAGPLTRALSRLPALEDPSVVLGLDRPDDAAAVRYGDRIVAATVDVFSAFTDDPFLVGQAAAANAVGDLHAKGVAPRHALAIVTIPEALPPEEALHEVMAGMRHTLDAEGVTVIGGHTTVGPTLRAGLTVLGDATADLWAMDAAQAGDRLVLTGKLGAGVLWRADGLGRAAGPWVEELVTGMLRGHRVAAEVAGLHGVRAATDVTGFGLGRHLIELVEAAGCSAEIGLDALSAYDGVAELLEQGVRSTFHEANGEAAAAMGRHGEIDQWRWELLFDPQTCGGLLLAVSASAAEALVEALRVAGETAAVLGELRAPRDDGRRVIVRADDRWEASP